MGGDPVVGYRAIQGNSLISPITTIMAWDQHRHLHWPTAPFSFLLTFEIHDMSTVSRLLIGQGWRPSVKPTPPPTEFRCQLPQAMSTFIGWLRPTVE